MTRLLVHAVLLVGWSFTTGALLLLPRLALGGLFFGLTVPPGFADGAEGRRIASRFRRAILAGSALALACVAAGAAASAPWPGAAGLAAQALGGTWAWVAARRRAAVHAVTTASSVRRAALAAPPPAVWPLLEAVPFAILGGAASLLHARWAEIPPVFPVHFALDGTPDGFAARTLAGVHGPLLAGAALCGLLVALRVGLARGGRALAADPRGAAVRRLSLASLLWAELLVAATLACAGLTPLGMSPIVSVACCVGGVALLLGAVTVALARVARTPPGAGGDNTPDAAWRWGGLFYVNREDPALFVPKRMGLGYTINFGHAGAWWALGLSVLGPLAIALALAVTGRR